MGTTPYYVDVIATLERLKASDTDECIEWTGSISKDGYPRTYDKRLSTTYVHRAVVQEIHGDRDSKVARHLCHNTKCINPRHLTGGSIQDNMDDMARAGRRRTRGRVLSDSDIIEIYCSGDTQAVLAERYGVTRAAISHVRTGRRGRHLTENLD